VNFERSRLAVLGHSLGRELLNIHIGCLGGERGVYQLLVNFDFVVRGRDEHENRRREFVFVGFDVVVFLWSGLGAPILCVLSRKHGVWEISHQGRGGPRAVWDG
jgi:hypothetical protein